VGSKEVTAMTSERSLAYGRVMKTLEDLGPAKLHDFERDAVRETADTLLFSTDNDPGADVARSDVEDLVHGLVESGRWTAETAARLLDDILGCGPEFVALSY
jgi:hypothetical protein